MTLESALTGLLVWLALSVVVSLLVGYALRVLSR